jgi:hypothetical protein
MKARPSRVLTMAGMIAAAVSLFRAEAQAQYFPPPPAWFCCAGGGKCQLTSAMLPGYPCYCVGFYGPVQGFSCY